MALFLLPSFACRIAVAVVAAEIEMSTGTHLLFREAEQLASLQCPMEQFRHPELGGKKRKSNITGEWKTYEGAPGTLNGRHGTERPAGTADTLITT